MTVDRGDLPGGASGWAGGLTSASTSASTSVSTEPALPPVAAPPEIPLARWSRRVVGALLDEAILGTVTFLAFAVQPVEPPGYVPSTPSGPAAGSWTESGWVVATVVTMLLMQAYLGSTPGKLAVGLAVVRDRDGRPVGVLRTIGRAGAHLADLILLIGYLRPLWHRERRTFADTLAGTVVLHTRRPLPHPALAGSADTPAVGSWELARPQRWRRPVTVAAVAVCVGAVAVMASQGYRSGDLVSRSCTVPGGGATPLASGSLDVRPDEAVVTRLGIERRVLEPDPGVAVHWHWEAWPVDDAVLDVTFARADGTGARTVDVVVRDGVVRDEAGVSVLDTELGVLLPLETVEGLGSDWTWTLRATVDGVTSPECVPS